ncbi:hypothetical protein [Microlunatus aurantiacus]|uniref:hypothetical protein n=1 Tax=Microlunatus aurantiacus TaxID=446786 RepID=UPI0031CFE86E
MTDRTRQQRRREAAAGLRSFTSEEEARLSVVVLPYVLVSLVVQCLLLVVGVRTVREMYGARHLGLRPLVSLAANRPLLVLLVLNLAQIPLNRRLQTWVRRLNGTPPG